MPLNAGCRECGSVAVLSDRQVERKQRFIGMNDLAGGPSKAWYSGEICIKGAVWLQ